MNKKSFLTGLLISLISYTGAAWAADNMQFSGTLRAHACSLHPDDGEINIDFGEIGTRDLYLQGGTPPQPFEIRLIDCNLAVASEVQVTFSGTPNTKIHGALALDVTSKASGFAIVLSNFDHTPISLGSTFTLPLVKGSNILQFYRQLQVEPDALLNDTITSGDFTANSTFTLIYP